MLPPQNGMEHFPLNEADERYQEVYGQGEDERRYLRNLARDRLAEMSPEPVTEREIRSYLLR